MINEKPMIWDLSTRAEKEEDVLKQTIFQNVLKYIEMQQPLTAREIALSAMLGRLNIYLKISGMEVEIDLWGTLPERKPQTNYEKLHGLSLGGMADFLLDIPGIDSFIPFCKDKKICTDSNEAGKKIPAYMCRNCMLDWLGTVEEVG